jgi:hypothetical protein
MMSMVASLALGCGGGSECEQIYEAEVKCRGKGGDKDKFMKMCSAAKTKDPEEFASAAKCAKAGSCDKMKECRDAVRGARRAKSVAKAVEAGNWKDAWDDCTLSADYFADATFKAKCVEVFAQAPTKLTGDDLRRAGFRCSGSDDLIAAVPEFGKACQALSAGAISAATAAVTKARDTGVRDFKACAELKSAAKAAGGDAVAKADALCEEASKAEGVKKGITKAKENAAAKKAQIPFQCDTLPPELEKLGTDWAKQKRDELLQACYVDFAPVILEIEGKNAKYSCPYPIKKLLEAAKKYDLATKFPALTESLKKLPKKCQA